MQNPRDVLRRVFGYTDFRGRQREVIDRLLAGLPTLAVMPTGAGKSVCYQVPALCLPGTALVISPLIALMHDQVSAAQAVGIRAAALTSADEDRDATIERFRAGDLDLLYAAPERASTPGFQRLLASQRLALVAVDEAHCVSEWGHDFRPDYRLLRPLLDGLPDVPRLALTATADRHTREDILAQLGIPDDGLILAGFDRPNIRYAMRPRDGLSGQLKQLLAEQAGPGIIYVPTRDATERLAAALTTPRRPVLAYHAGMDPGARAANQRAFVGSESMVMVATVAFGMGIDKPDVRFVAHAAAPKSIEGYYQETGRAGRDGDPAVAELFWGAEDFARARRRIATEIEAERQASERARLDSLAALLETGSCRRAMLLRYFGDDAPVRCGNCDNCLDPPRTVDVSELARKLLSAVYRTGQRFGLGHVSEVLVGKTGERIVALGHDRLSVHGIVDAREARLLKPIARALIARDVIAIDDHGGLSLGAQARAVLRAECSVEILLPVTKAPRRQGRDLAEAPHDPLFEALRAWRRDVAAKRSVPPYVVFHDATLRAVAAARPMTMAELGAISGVGAAKLADYGRNLLAVVRTLAQPGQSGVEIRDEIGGVLKPDVQAK